MLVGVEPRIPPPQKQHASLAVTLPESLKKSPEAIHPSPLRIPPMAPVSNDAQSNPFESQDKSKHFSTVVVVVVTQWCVYPSQQLDRTLASISGVVPSNKQTALWQ